MGNGFGIALAGMWLLSQTAPAPTPPTEPRYYLIQVRIIEVDEQGKQTVVATPSLQTTGDATGVTVDPKRGRKFEFHFSAIDPNAPATASNDEATGKPVVTADGMKLEKSPPARVTLKAVQQSRKEILKAIADQAGMQLMLDADTVAATAAPLLTPISLELDNTPVEEAIRQIVEPAKLNFAVRQDLVLIGATPLRPAPTKTAAAVAPILVPPSTLPAGNPTPLEVPANPNALSVRVYAVQDLVTLNAQTQRPEFKPLIEQIQKSVSSDSWDNQGGMATIRGFDSTVSLVVRQTAAGHDAVAKFLDERRAKSTAPLTP